MDSGSDRTCLTFERRTVTWQDGCGHVDEHSAILRTRLSSLSAVFWWGVIGTTNKTICGAHVWIRPRVSSVHSYPRECLLPTGTDLVRFTWFAVECYMPVRELRSTSFSVIPITSPSFPSCFRPSRHFSVTVVSLFYLPFIIVFYRLPVFRLSSIPSLRIYSAPFMFRASFLGFVATLS